tara:strand:- start:1323 stop:1589 length:267 start_codon:yes stop_codon:yes gene_type:complete
MSLRAPVKFHLLVIIFYAAAFSASAEEVFPDATPLDADEAFVIDHMVTGPNEAVVRWQIPKTTICTRTNSFSAARIFTLMMLIFLLLQ